MGSTHVGATGLRTTLAEARAALAAGHAGRRLNAATSFDEVGLKRTLIEWFASDTAREAVDSLLRPLDDLGPQKRDTALQTLRSYLDNQGSASRAAVELHLHRNAIAYRVRRIFDLLDVDHPDGVVRRGRHQGRPSVGRLPRPRDSPMSRVRVVHVVLRRSKRRRGSPLTGTQPTALCRVDGCGRRPDIVDGPPCPVTGR